MTTKTEHLDDMTERAAYTIVLGRDDPEGGDDVALAALITDTRGKALAIEIGSGDHGAYASIRAFDGEDETEPMVFVESTSTMIVVE